MGGIIFGLIVLVIGGLFTLAENHKTRNMNGRKQKKEDSVCIVRSHQKLSW